MKILTTVLAAFCFLAGNAQNLSLTSTEQCLGDTTILTANSDIASVNVLRYDWDLDNDGFFDDDTGKVVHYIFSKADSHYVSFQITTINSDEYRLNPQLVLVNPLPKVSFETFGLCFEDTTFFSNKSSIRFGSIAQYQWDFQNDGIEDFSGINASYKYSASGSFSAKLKLTSDKGCADSLIKTITIYQLPVVDFNSQSFCVNDSVSFTNFSALSGDSIIEYVWNFGDGIQSFQINPKHSYSLDGYYEVSLIAISKHECADSTAQTITILPTPQFNLDFDGDTVFYKGSHVGVSVSGSQINGIQWSTGESSTSVSIMEAGNYQVTVTGDNTCQAASSFHVTVNELGSLRLVSNIITPNGDGINDLLSIKAIDAYKTCEVGVFNAWGDQVFSSSGYKNDWPATRKDKPLEAGAYYYVIKCDDQEIKGNVNVLR